MGGFGGGDDGFVGTKVDVTIKGYDGETELNLPLNAFSGDRYEVTPGFRKLVFYPLKTSYTNLWADVTNDVYKTDKLVLRRVPVGTFMMGSPDSELGRVSANENRHQVTLTHDYFIAIYQMTQKQWEHITGTAPSCYWAGSSRPRDSVSCDNLRGIGCFELTGTLCGKWRGDGRNCCCGFVLAQ